MEKEQIIKALECCKANSGVACSGCPYMHAELADDESCSERMALNALTLIKELTEENANLHASCTDFAQKCASLTKENAQLKHIELEALRGAANSYKKLYKKSAEENDRLKRICESYALQYGTATDKEVFLKRERADTVREMQERLKERFDDFYNSGEDALLDVPELIDEIANEILNKNTEE